MRSRSQILGFWAAIALTAGCGPQSTPQQKGASGGSVEVASTLVPAGTTLAATLLDGVSSERSRVGDPVTLRTVAPVSVHQQVVVPAGATIRGSVSHVQSAGRISGASELTLRFDELVLPNGTTYPITASRFRVHTGGDGRATAEQIGGGAAAGGVLGGLIGGKDDILKGAAIGAAVGTGFAVATKGNQIVLTPGQKMHVTLEAPVRIQSRTAS